MIHVDTSMRRGKQDEKKAEQERLQGILLDMLKEDENKYCADCQAKTPRWAAWNLGVFICIRCAGIHRNLGVHISKVRSVNLDSWTPEQVQSMRVMGNEKARKVYEHSLPEHFRRSMSDHQMEQFIRAKYEQKRYMLPNFVYPRVDANDLPKPGQPVTKQKSSTTTPSLTSPSNARVSAATTVSSTTKPQGAVVNDLLDFTSPASPPNQANGDISLAGDLSSLSFANDQNVPTNNKSDLDDMFGSFASAPVIESGVIAGVSDQASSSDSAKEPSPNSQSDADLMSLSNAATTNGEKKSNADILSLFGDQSKGPIHPIMSVGGFAAFGLQAAPSQPQQSIASNDPFGAPSGATPVVGTAPIGAPGMNTTPMVAPAMGVAPLRMPAMGVPFGAPVMGVGVMAAPFGGTFPLQPSGFPNPFEQQAGGAMGPQGFPGMIPTSAASMVSAPAAQQQHSPTTPGFSSRANNAFADLSIGKVLNMNYMNAKSSMSSAPAKSQPTATPSNMNFDDLLGL